MTYFSIFVRENEVKRKIMAYLKWSLSWRYWLRKSKCGYFSPKGIVDYRLNTKLVGEWWMWMFSSLRDFG